MSGSGCWMSERETNLWRSVSQKRVRECSLLVVELREGMRVLVGGRGTYRYRSEQEGRIGDGVVIESLWQKRKGNLVKPSGEGEFGDVSDLAVRVWTGPAWQRKGRMTTDNLVDRYTHTHTHTLLISFSLFSCLSLPLLCPPFLCSLVVSMVMMLICCVWE